MSNSVLRTYKFYDVNGRRLSVFAQELEPGLLDIFVLACSKGDQFNKKFAQERYESYLLGEYNYTVKGGKLDRIHPLELQVPVIENKPAYTLLKYCKLNFYKKYVEEIIIQKEKITFIKQNVFNIIKEYGKA